MDPLAETALLLAEEMSVAAAELLETSGLDTAEFEELVAVGIFPPHTQGTAGVFPASSIALARAAASLRTTFDLTPEALALVMRYRCRVLELERRVRELECQLASAQGRES